MSRSWSAVCDLQDSPRSRYLRRGLSQRLEVWHSRRLGRRLHLWMRGLRRLGLHAPEITPEWLRFAETGKRLGSATARAPSVEWHSSSEETAQEIWHEWGVGEDERVVAIAPAAAWPTKEWPVTHALELARDLCRRGIRVLFLGAAKERERLGELSQWVESEPRAFWPDKPLPVLAALLSRCRVALTPDSGLMHLAAAVGIPVVALFGSTVPELGFAPTGYGHHLMVRRLDCQPCALHGKQRCPLGHFSCLADITPEQVRAPLMERLIPERLSSDEPKEGLA